MLERLKELETTQNYSEMLNELKKHESISTQAYIRLSSLITNPTIEGILKALSEMSVSATSLLRHCISLLEEEIVDAPLAGETEVSSISTVSHDTSRDRDDMFTLDSLNVLLTETAPSELSEGDTKINAKFWYIKGKTNESIELTVSEKEIFANILVNILKQIEARSDEKFSISPLGYEVLLRHQFYNSFSKIVKTYGIEFTLIKLYS